MILPSQSHPQTNSLALALLCGLLLLICGGCAAAPVASEPPPDLGSNPPQPVPSAMATLEPIEDLELPEPDAGDTPDPTPAAIERKIAIEAPKRMEQGSTANLYLSFGAPDRQANLPGSPDAQQDASPALLPSSGVVRPGLDVPGNLRVEAVDVEPVSVENAIPKRWHWRITITDEQQTTAVQISPYLNYSETPGGASRVIWPEQKLTITIEVTAPPVQQRLLGFLGDASSTLQLFGVSVVMLIAWGYSFGKWVWPRLTGKNAQTESSSQS